MLRGASARRGSSVMVAVSLLGRGVTSAWEGRGRGDAWGVTESGVSLWRRSCVRGASALPVERNRCVEGASPLRRIGTLSVSLLMYSALSLSRYFLGWWCHCWHCWGTLLACKPAWSKTKILSYVNHHWTCGEQPGSGWHARSENMTSAWHCSLQQGRPCSVVKCENTD